METDKDSSQFNSMTKLSTTLKKEFFELLPPTIYFFVALHIVAFVRVLMLKKTGIAPSSSISIAVAALILGKAVLDRGHAAVDQSFSAKTADLQHRLEDRYLLVAFCCHSLSGTADRISGARRRFVAGNQKLLSEIVWPHFWAHPDHSLRPHRRVLHGARICAGDW